MTTASFYTRAAQLQAAIADVRAIATALDELEAFARELVDDPTIDDDQAESIIAVLADIRDAAALETREALAREWYRHGIASTSAEFNGESGALDHPAMSDAIEHGFGVLYAVAG